MKNSYKYWNLAGMLNVVEISITCIKHATKLYHIY